MIEVIATANFARQHKLRATGDSLLRVDGPAGFALSVMHVGGDPCGYARVGTGRASGTLRRGESILVKDATEVWTMGRSSTVDVVSPRGKGKRQRAA
jgi:hypothetical protein